MAPPCPAPTTPAPIGATGAQGMAPPCPYKPAEASYAPMYAHLALVLSAGIYLPPPLVTWFQNVAGLLG